MTPYELAKQLKGTKWRFIYGDSHGSLVSELPMEFVGDEWMAFDYEQKRYENVKDLFGVDLDWGKEVPAKRGVCV